jgi:hypothetical protein
MFGAIYFGEGYFGGTPIPGPITAAAACLMRLSAVPAISMTLTARPVVQMTLEAK